MDTNPYQSPPETTPAERPRRRRRVNFPAWTLAASLAAALVLVSVDAPRWLVVLAGACSALAGEEWIRRSDTNK